MEFVVSNQAQISNKNIRFAKWKILKLSRRFCEILYSEIYIVKMSEVPLVYKTTIKLGVPGPDIIVSATSDNLNEMWAELSAKMKRQLRKYASKKS